ncbi:PilZ domain-containing protein [Bradyrhizobium sp. CCBAU 45384]|uniref:PilZ domain-containing protein n=2 Tax=Nitrobacteraceae TaxID=41294 RepID=A0A0R3D3F1_9BRAD|nr:PilZ domain-containing protein [Bradyrhizobium sp. CCBAU 45384]KRQ02021.1 hypothetical protein AOQ71_36090 [Bradyrhizobium manausense]MDA9405241.1 hypothetical protein [Bradyrhizobium sp. CCBAU 45384]
MVETRNAPRVRTAMPAHIERAGKKITCMIRDISTSGAALQFFDGTDRIPASFDLIIPEHGLKLSCRVAWRAPFRMGVMFL